MGGCGSSHFARRSHVACRAAGRRAFTLLDLMGLVACAAIVLCAATAGLSRSHNASNLVVCSARLGGIGAGSANFAFSHKDVFFGFTWLQGGNNSQFADLNAQQSQGPMQAHAAQAVDFLRRRGVTTAPPLHGWIPNPTYSALALTEFESRPLSDLYDICPIDDSQLKWRRSPASFALGRFLPRQPFPDPHNSHKFPYRSSYILNGAAFDRNQSNFTPQAQAFRIENSGQHNFYSTTPNSNLGPSLQSTVAFPSSKAHMSDEADRHFVGRTLHYTYAQARGPVLFFDGSVSVRTSGDAITPWQPREPQLPTALSLTYHPKAWEPPTPSGLPEQVTDRFRWTRNGLLGRDFK